MTVVMKTELYSRDKRIAYCDTLTIGELIEALRKFPSDARIVTSNGIGYGRIWAGFIKEATK